MAGAMTQKLTVSVAEDGTVSCWLQDEDEGVVVVASGDVDAVGEAAREALEILLSHARERIGRSRSG